MEPLNNDLFRGRFYFMSSSDEVEQLPIDMVNLIFSNSIFCSRDLAACNCVCKYWKGLIKGGDLEIAQGIEKLVAEKKLFFFGKAEWEAYFGSVSQAPPLPRKICDLLNSQNPLKLEGETGCRVAETHQLLLLPSQVKGEKLTLSSFGELVQHPKLGSSTRYAGGELEVSISEQYGSDPIGKSRWLLITKKSLEGSRGESFEKQRAMVEGYSGYGVPRAIEVATALFIKYVTSEEWLFGNVVGNYIQCQEQIGTASHLIVCSFAEAGVHITQNEFEDDTVGVAARKLL